MNKNYSMDEENSGENGESVYSRDEENNISVNNCGDEKIVCGENEILSDCNENGILSDCKNVCSEDCVYNKKDLISRENINNKKENININSSNINNNNINNIYSSDINNTSSTNIHTNKNINNTYSSNINNNNNINNIHTNNNNNNIYNILKNNKKFLIYLLLTPWKYKNLSFIPSLCKSLQIDTILIEIILFILTLTNKDYKMKTLSYTKLLSTLINETSYEKQDLIIKRVIEIDMSIETRLRVLFILLENVCMKLKVEYYWWYVCEARKCKSRDVDNLVFCLYEGYRSKRGSGYRKGRECGSRKECG